MKEPIELISANLFWGQIPLRLIWISFWFCWHLSRDIVQTTSVLLLTLELDLTRENIPIFTSITHHFIDNWWSGEELIGRSESYRDITICNLVKNMETVLRRTILTTRVPHILSFFHFCTIVRSMFVMHI